MELIEFRPGETFWCAGRRWRCTDIGARVVVAISLESRTITQRSYPHGIRGAVVEHRYVTDDPSWLNGPPYAVAEEVFDEYAQEACTQSPDDEG